MKHLFLFLLLLSCEKNSTEAVAQTVFDNVDSYYELSADARFRKAIDISRNSELKIITRGVDGSIGLGTGAYITTGDSYYVITAAHVVSDSITLVTEVESVYYSLTPFLILPDTDTAILKVEPILGRTPINIAKGNIATDVSIGEKVLYTGYPNITGPLTVFGTVATIFDAKSILLQSYAWAGASGSVVLNVKGEIVAVLSGIEIFIDGQGLSKSNPNIVLVHKVPKNLKQIIDYAEKSR